MVELKKKAAAAVTPINSGAIVAGLSGMTILIGNQPYPDQTTTPTNLSVTASNS